MYGRIMIISISYFHVGRRRREAEFLAFGMKFVSLSFLSLLLNLYPRSNRTSVRGAHLGPVTHVLLIEVQCLYLF